jgi:hypothetical protein
MFRRDRHRCFARCCACTLTFPAKAVDCNTLVQVRDNEDTFCAGPEQLHAEAPVPVLIDALALSLVWAAHH